MKALILVGGYGTRLRPLTLSVPKPLVPFAEYSCMLEGLLEALSKVGVTVVILAINYQADVMLAALSKLEEKYGIKVVCSKEDEPLGTAGPLALAREYLEEDGDPFFVFNSDITCDYPLEAMLTFHKAHGREGTIMVTKVEEPSKYGVVLADGKGMITEFVEKPQVFVGNHINAGLYMFNPSILKRIKPVPTSIERDIFPVMAKEGDLYRMVLPGYWMDIGQPKDYLTGMCMHLASVRERKPARLAGGPNVLGDVIIHESAKVAEDAVIGPNVVIGPDCIVESGARVQRTTMMEGSVARAHCFIKSSIIGWRSIVGKWTRVENDAVIGENVKIKDELCLNGTIVLPHKSVGASHYDVGKIIM